MREQSAVYVPTRLGALHVTVTEMAQLKALVCAVDLNAFVVVTPRMKCLDVAFNRWRRNKQLIDSQHHKLDSIEVPSTRNWLKRSEHQHVISRHRPLAQQFQAAGFDPFDQSLWLEPASL